MLNALRITGTHNQPKTQTNESEGKDTLSLAKHLTVTVAVAAVVLSVASAKWDKRAIFQYIHHLRVPTSTLIRVKSL